MSATLLQTFRTYIAEGKKIEAERFQKLRDKYSINMYAYPQDIALDSSRENVCTITLTKGFSSATVSSKDWEFFKHKTIAVGHFCSPTARHFTVWLVTSTLLMELTSYRILTCEWQGVIEL